MQNIELLQIRRLHQLRRMTYENWFLDQMEKKPIDFKQIYKEKKNTKGEVERYKVKLVTKGCSQKHEIDYDEIFAPVA